jgi:hypothetical protein
MGEELLNMYSQFPASLLLPLVRLGLAFRGQMLFIGEPLHQAFSPIYNSLYAFGASIGLKEDQTVYVLMLLGTYPLSLIYRLLFFNNRFISRRVREFVLASVGIFITFFVFGYTAWHPVISAVASWLLMKIGGRRASFLVFLFAWGYLSMTYVYP